MLTKVVFAALAVAVCVIVVWLVVTTAVVAMNRILDAEGQRQRREARELREVQEDLEAAIKRAEKKE